MYRRIVLTKGRIYPMQNHKKVAFIGAGNMGGAIIRGFLSKKVLAPENIVVCCKTPTRYSSYLDLGVSVSYSISDAVKDAAYIFLCVKPKDVSSVVAEACSSPFFSSGAVFVSVAASVSTSMICSFAGRDVPVIRTMPGMPLLVGEGTVAISRNSFVEDRLFQYICRLFSSIAMISVLDESLMNPVIAVNGSSPAYVFYFVKAMLLGAEKQGIDASRALPLILQTITGSVKMLENSDLSIDEQISRICSPKGTTLEAMSVLCDSDFCSLIENAMDACTSRANEITSELQT